MEINYGAIKKAAKVYRAMNHPLRKAIIALLASGELSVTEIMEQMKLIQSVCSQQLAILRMESIVTTRREKKNIYYKLNLRRVLEIERLSKELNSYTAA